MEQFYLSTYLQVSNTSPLPRAELHSESEPLPACFPKPLVTPAEETKGNDKE